MKNITFVVMFAAVVSCMNMYASHGSNKSKSIVKTFVDLGDGESVEIKGGHALEVEQVEVLGGLYCMLDKKKNEFQSAVTVQRLLRKTDYSDIQAADSLLQQIDSLILMNTQKLKDAARGSERVAKKMNEQAEIIAAARAREVEAENVYWEQIADELMAELHSGK